MNSILLKDFSHRGYNIGQVKPSLKVFFIDLLSFVMYLIVKVVDIVMLIVLWIFDVLVNIRRYSYRFLWRKRAVGKGVVVLAGVIAVLFMGVFYDFLMLFLADVELLNQLQNRRQIEAFSQDDVGVLSEYGQITLDFELQDAFSFYTYYTVRKGDTLEGIAKKHGVKVETVMWANNLNRRSILRPGQVLKVPLEDGVIHRVKRGDTLEKIAKKYKSTVQDILEANWLDSPDQIQVGMELFVPKGTMPTPEVASVVKHMTTTRVQKAPVSNSNSCSGFPKFLTSWPVLGGGRISRGPTSYHNAIDITYKPGQDMHPYILAAADGVVTFAGIKGCGYRSRRCGYAWTVVIDHGNGYSTLYAHLQANSLLVKLGQRVKAGQAVARMGNTGYTVGGTGIHLHFEVRRTGTWSRKYRYNPFCFFK